MKLIDIDEICWYDDNKGHEIAYKDEMPKPYTDLIPVSVLESYKKSLETVMDSYEVGTEKFMFWYRKVRAVQEILEYVEMTEEEEDEDD